MPPEFAELAAYNARVADGIAHDQEHAARMADLQAQFNAWNEWQMRKEGFRPEELTGGGTVWVKGPAA